MLIVLVNVSEMLSLNGTFQDLFNDILYFSVAQNFVDFVMFTCLCDRGNV